MESGGYGSSKAPFLAAVENGIDVTEAKEPKVKEESGRKSQTVTKTGYPGLKNPTKKQVALNMPPTPRGFVWRPADEGWGLWRAWSEWDDDKKDKIKKSRYTGHLSQDAWEIMKKEYDNEAYISTVGERIRRHGGR